jgi:uncharacterized protein (TIGR02246 family)
VRKFARGAIAVAILIAWAIPCHDREAAAARERRVGETAGADRPRPREGREISRRVVYSTDDSTMRSPGADSVSARRDVDAGNAQFVKAWMCADAGLFAACFAEDGAMLPPGGRVILGRDTIRVRMASVFARYRMITGTITTLDLHVVGDRAYETGRWVFTLAGIGREPEAQPDTGYFVEIWKKEGPTWRMWSNIGVPRG